jgi:hypothetical protein
MLIQVCKAGVSETMSPLRGRLRIAHRFIGGITRNIMRQSVERTAEVLREEKT